MGLRPCPAGIVAQLERLLRESFTLADPSARRAFANACKPFVKSFNQTALALELTSALSAQEWTGSGMMEAAAQIGFEWDSDQLSGFLACLEDRPEVTKHVLALILSPGNTSTVHSWRRITKAIQKRRDYATFEAVFSRFRASGFRDDRSCCALLCSAMLRVPVKEWVPALRNEAFDQLWPASLAGVEEPHFATLLSTSALCERKDRFEALFSALSQRPAISKFQVSMVAQAAGKLKDAGAVRAMFAVAAADTGDPFQTHALWATLLDAAYKAEDIPLFMEIFAHLRSRFKPLRRKNWGTLGGQLRKLAPSLPVAEAQIMLSILNHQEVDIALCMDALRTEDLTIRSQRGGEIPFAGAARELMQWMINAYIGESSGPLTERARLVVEGIQSLPDDRRREAIFHLFARGQGSYAGAMTAHTIRELNALAQSYRDMDDKQIAQLVSEPSMIRNEIVKLIDTGRLTKPEGTPPPRLERGLKLVAELTLRNQQDLFSGLQWPGTIWFDQLSPLTDGLSDTSATSEEWEAGLAWFIKAMSAQIVLMMGASAFVHEFVNAFDDEWSAWIAANQHDSEAGRGVIEAFVKRVHETLASISGVRTGDRETIRASTALAGGKLRLDVLPVPDYAVAYPRKIKLWLIPGQGNDGLAPLVTELRRNAEKSLSALDEADRFYRFEVTPEDNDWMRLTVQNSFDPEKLSERPSSGFGSLIIPRLCRRLRARNTEAREPLPAEQFDFPGHPGLRIYAKTVFLPRGNDELNESRVTRSDEEETGDDGDDIL